MIRVARALLVATGLGFGLYGAKLVLDLGLPNLFAAAKWLVGGVVLHDGVIGPVVIVVGVLGARLLRGPLPAAVIVGAVVLGSLTLASVPMIGRFGALEDNPSLLPRNYVVGWLVLAGLISVTVTAALLVDRRAARGGGHGASAGRR